MTIRQRLRQIVRASGDERERYRCELRLALMALFFKDRG